jgi:hypothetical protein
MIKGWNTTIIWFTFDPIIIIIIISIRSIYNYIPAANNDCTVYNITSVVWLKYMLQLMLFPTIKVLHFYISTSLSTCFAPSMALLSSSLRPVFQVSCSDVSWSSFLIILLLSLLLLLLWVYVCGLLVHLFSFMFLCFPCNWPFGCCVNAFLLKNWTELICTLCHLRLLKSATAFHSLTSRPHFDAWLYFEIPLPALIILELFLRDIICIPQVQYVSLVILFFKP